MVTLTKALGLQSPKIETPAEKARQAVAQYHAQCNDTVYHLLLNFIASESAKGAVRLSLWHYDDTSSPYAEITKPKDDYINGVVDVRINIESLIDTKEMVSRLEHDGFAVNTLTEDKFGLVIDTISWE